MGKRPAGVELFEGNMASMQREIRPSMQRDEPPTMENRTRTNSRQGAVNPRPKSVVQEICTLRSVGGGGRRLPPPTRWVPSNGHPYRNPRRANRAIFRPSLARVYWVRKLRA